MGQMDQVYRLLTAFRVNVIGETKYSANSDTGTIVKPINTVVVKLKPILAAVTSYGQTL